MPDRNDELNVDVAPKSRASFFWKSLRYLVVLESERLRVFHYSVYSSKGRQAALDLAKRHHVVEHPEDSLLRVKEVSEIHSEQVWRGYDLISPEDWK